MSIGLILDLVALAFVLLITFIFFSKKRINLLENKIYGFILIITIFGLIINAFSFILDISFTEQILFRKIFLKLYYDFLILLINSITLYLLAVINRNINNKKLGLFALISTILLVINSLLPLSLSEVDSNYLSGYSIYAVYILMAISVIFWIILIIKNIKTYKTKLYPLLLYAILLFPVFYLQILNSELLLETVLISFILVLMYHTIENPDMKMLEEVHKSKEISDTANDEKNLFIYNMTQESRKVTTEITQNINYILESDSIEEIKDLARNVLNSTARYSEITYDILGADNTTTNNFKVYKTKYSLKNILKEIVSINIKKTKEKEIIFKTSIDHNIPETLLGDSIQLKNAINDLIDYILLKKEINYINFNVSSILKENTCRLLITIESNGLGMTSEELAKELNDKSSLADINKRIIKMNGIMSITSNIDIGTKYSIIIDQIFEEETSEIKKYQSVFDNKKILCVDDS